MEKRENNQEESDSKYCVSLEQIDEENIFPKHH